MVAPAVFAFGLVAFGFLGMGPVTIAVDSYGPVTDNAQSVFELSMIESHPEHRRRDQEGLRLRRRTSSAPSTSSRRTTARATPSRPPPSRCSSARPSSGATTMIFSIIMVLTEGLRPELVARLSILHPPFLLGLVTGGAIIYWFTGASMQAVTTGAYRAVEFIKANIKLDSGAEKASVEDSEARSSRSARSTRRRGCSTSSSACSSPRWRSPSTSRSSSSAT